MNRKILLAMLIALLLLAAGCGGQQSAASQPTAREGVVFVDPNQVTAAPAAATAAPLAVEATAAPVQASPEPEEAPAAEPEGESAPELYFESNGVRMEPWMEAEPVLAALGEPIGCFEADSCAYIGKDLFYWYPGFELTVNDVEGAYTHRS